MDVNRGHKDRKRGKEREGERYGGREGTKVSREGRWVKHYRQCGRDVTVEPLTLAVTHRSMLSL